MDRDAANISTEYQPKGSGLNPSDTLDKPDIDQPRVEKPINRNPAGIGSADVVDEKGRPLNGDGTAAN